MCTRNNKLPPFGHKTHNRHNKKRKKRRACHISYMKGTVRRTEYFSPVSQADRPPLPCTADRQTQRKILVFFAQKISFSETEFQLARSVCTRGCQAPKKRQIPRFFAIQKRHAKSSTDTPTGRDSVSLMASTSARASSRWARK